MILQRIIKMKALRSILRKTYRWILAIVFVVMIILIVRRYIITRGYKSAVGKYITTGGQSYLVIDKGFFRSLDTREGFSS
jgi:hypothetical protein